MTAARNRKTLLPHLETIMSQSVHFSSEKSKVQEYNEQHLKYTDKYESPDTCILIENAVKQSKISKAAGLVVEHILQSRPYV